MKIAILLESFQPEYWGGRETRWKNLIGIFARSNELIIYGDFSKFSSDVAFPDVPAKFINIGPLPPMYGPNGNRSFKHAVLYTFKSYKILFSKSDILLTDQTPLISIPFIRLLTYISKVQLSITWHEVWSVQTWLRYSKFIAVFGVLLQEIALLFSNNIVVPSVTVAADLQNRLFSRKPTVIVNGVKSNFYTSDVNLSQSRNSNIGLLYVGRLIKHKNCDFLIDIMDQAIRDGKNWNLTIVGIGPLEAKLKDLVRRRNLKENVIFKSNIPENELTMLYSSSDVFVFPSEREGYGISVAEAISHKLPVLIYDCPENAARSLVQTIATGIKLEELDTSRWILAIEELLLNQEHNQLDSENEFVNWETIGNEYLDFLKSLMRSRRFK